jgi:hypothetical protein
MKTETIIGLSGINRQTSSFLLNVGEIRDTFNLTSKKIGILKKTFDYTIKNAQIVASQSILGGVDFYRNAGTHEHFVAIDGASNAEIYKDVTGVWTTQSQSLTKNKKVRFDYSPSLDTLFAVNYSDATRSYNGSSWSTVTNVTSAPKAKYIKSFGRRIYLLNVDVSGTAYFDRAYRSSLVDSGSITWDVTNDWLTVDDVITGVGKHGDSMVIFGENSVTLFTLSDEQYPISSIGCVSHESIAAYSTWIFWAARDGMYAWNGSKDIKISLPIQPYWDGISEANLSNIQSEVIGDRLIVYVGNLTLPETLTNVIFEYNISQNNWNRGYLANSITHLHTFVTSSGKSLFAGDNNGKVFQMFTGSAQNTAVYTSGLETDWIYGSGANITDDFYEVWGYGNKLSALKVMYKLDTDNNKWEPLGELNGDIDFVKFGENKRGRKIRLLLMETSKSNLYELERIDLVYNPVYKQMEDTET